MTFNRMACFELGKFQITKIDGIVRITNTSNNEVSFIDDGLTFELVKEIIRLRRKTGTA